MSGERKTEPPLKLDMDFAEALERFVQTKPREVADSIERSKQKKPPQDDVPRQPEVSRSRPTGSPPPGRKRKPSGGPLG